MSNTILECKKKHARCGFERPCFRCESLGLDCKDVPKKKRKRRGKKQKPFSFKEETLPKRKRVCSSKTNQAKISPNDFQLGLENLQPTIQPSQVDVIYQHVHLDKGTLDSCFDMSFQTSSYVEDDTHIEKALIPIQVDLANLKNKSGYCEGYAISRDLPKLDFWSPSLQHKLGYESNENLTLWDIMDQQDADEWVQDLNAEIEEREQFIKLNGQKPLVDYCLETHCLRRKILFDKMGCAFEVVCDLVKSWRRDDPTKLESLTCQIYWPENFEAACFI